MFSTKRTPPKQTLRSEQSVSEPDLAQHLSKQTWESDANVTMRKRKQPDCCADFTEIKNSLLELKSSLDTNLVVINENIKTIKIDLKTYTKNLKKEIDSLRSENVTLQKNFNQLSDLVSEIKSSAQFISNQYDDSEKRLKKLEDQTTPNLDAQDALKSLERKLEILEQQSRQCNIEISNVPERRGENLTALLGDISKHINIAIPKDQVTAAHRVPHATSNDRPKNIIVKFSTRILRDNILSACRLKKGITTSDLGISGNSRNVYINEHLTLHKKQLLRESRETAKKHGFKFVWVKHSNILARRNETSPIIAIRNSNDLCKIKTNTTN